MGFRLDLLRKGEIGEVAMLILSAWWEDEEESHWILLGILLGEMELVWLGWTSK
jgi:hypothetical protein